MKRSSREMYDEDDCPDLETTGESILKILNGPTLPTCYKGQSDFSNIGSSSITVTNIIGEYRNFEPKRVLRQVARRAAVSGTSPECCAEEISNLIISHFHANNARINSVSPNNEDWYKDMLKLEAKYGLKKGNDPDLISFKRLCFMFPHVSVMARAENFENQILICTEKVAKVFHFEEFGGLIPTTRFLKKDVREGLVLIHLFCLKKRYPYIKDHFLQVLLKRTIDNGILTDERRIHFLKIRGIIESNGDLSIPNQKLVRSLNTTYSTFTTSVHWSLLN